MKKTKRFIALLLAILMILTGVLSGIPGGGVARAEEWDVGSEIIGDWTVSDWMEEEPAPEQKIEEESAQEKEEENGNVFASEEGTAGVQEIIQEDGVVEEAVEEVVTEETLNGGSVEEGSSSVVVEEEAEEEDAETLTDGVFGEYDPASVAEAEFDVKDNSIESGDRFDGEREYVEEEGEEDLLLAEDGSDEENNLRGVSPIKNETLAGASYTIYFDTSWNKGGGGWTKSMNYVYVYGYTSNDSTQGYLITTTETVVGGDGTNQNIIKIEFTTDYTRIRLLSVQDKWSPETYRSEFISIPLSNGNNAIRLNGPGADDHNVGDGVSADFYQYTESGNDPTPGGDTNDPDALTQLNDTDANALVLYYDASLSIIVRDKDDDRWKKTLPYRTFNYADGTTTHTSPVYLVIGSEHYTQKTPMTTTEITALEGKRASGDAGKGTFLYKFTIDKTKLTDNGTVGAKSFYFTTDRHTKGDANTADASSMVTGNDCSRTHDIKLPPGELATMNNEGKKTIVHNCFYGDSGDDCIYGSDKRGGYWDTVQGPRDPERRSKAKGNYTYGTAPNEVTVPSTEYYNHVVPTEAMTSDAIIDSIVNVHTSTNVPQTQDVQSGQTYGQLTNQMVGKKVLDVTLYDYYSDYELNGNNRDGYPKDNETGNNAGNANERSYYPFMGLNHAMSAAYKTGTEPVSLYTGHFQRSTYGGATFGWRKVYGSNNNTYWYSNSDQYVQGLAGYGNWLYDFYDDKTRITENSSYLKFMSHNNSTVTYDNDLAGSDSGLGASQYGSAEYQAVSWGLVDTNTKKDGDGHTKGAGLYTHNNSMLLPYFDTGFLDGDNVLSTKVGKVYPDVKFPFSIERRKKDSSTDQYVDYYVFAARNDMMSTSSTYKTSRQILDGSNHAIWLGDASILRRNGTNYFVNVWPNISIGSSSTDLAKGTKSIENAGAAADRKNSMGFFPFNEDVDQDNLDARKTSKYNYGYGMKFEAKFKMRKDGMVVAKKADGTEYTLDDAGNNLTEFKKYLSPVKFRFSGDDDVWVFIDGELVLDLGGAHSAAEGEIWFADEKITDENQQKVTSSVGQVAELTGDTLGGQCTTVDGVVKKSPDTPDAEKRNTGDPATNTTIKKAGTDFTFSDYDPTVHDGSYGIHTLTMYYMERGMWESNMMIEFNLEAYPADSPKVDLFLNKAWNPGGAAADEVQFKVYAKESANGTPMLVTDENGNGIFTIEKGKSQTKVEGLEAFIDGDKTKNRFIYEVYELDKDGVEHFVGSIGGGGNNDNPTQIDRATAKTANSLAANDTDSFEILYHTENETSTYQVYSFDGETNVPTGMVPKFQAGGNQDGEYYFTATNRATMDLTVTKVFEGFDGSGITAAGVTPSVKLVLASSTSESGPFTVLAQGVGRTEGGVYTGTKNVSDGTLSCTWSDLPRTYGTDSYYYKVFEVSPASDSTITAGTELTTEALGKCLSEGALVQLGDYYYTVGYKHEGATVGNCYAAPSVGDMDFTVTNKAKPPKLTVRKLDAANNASYLEAEFSLFEYKNSSEVTPAAKVLNVPNNATGAEIDFSEEGLGPGTYHLKETNPPLGYVRQPGVVEITVTNVGGITASGSGGFSIHTNTPSTNGTTGVKGVTLDITNARDVVEKTIHKVWLKFDGSADTTVPHSAIFKLTGTKSSTNHLIGYIAVTESSAGSPDGTWTLQNNLPTTNGEDWSLASVSAAAQTAGTAGSWDITVSNLPNGYSYSFAEVSDTNADSSTIVIADTDGATGIIGGYRATYTSSNETFTNRKLISASVEKSWQKDGSALSPTPASSIYVALMRTTASPQPVDPASSEWSVVSGYDNIELTGNTSDPSSDWKASITDLDYADLSTGNRYYYRFYELTGSSGTKIANNGFYNGVYKVGYGSYASQDSGTGTVTQTIVNNYETVAVQLTKEWPTTTANSIIINLESSTDSAFSDPSPSVVQQFTITKSTSTNPTFGSTNSSTMTLATGETATLSFGTITGGSTWILSIPGLPKYSEGSPLYYRFVEMKDASTRAEDEQQVGDYLVDYKDVTSGIGKTALVNSVYTQTIQNKLARFQLSVAKAFSGGTNLPTSMTGQNVYIRLMRKAGDTPDSTFNANNSNVVTLDGTLETSPAAGKDCYEVSAWTGTWLNLERTNASGNYYTYYAVEVVPDGSGGYTDKSTGDSVEIGSNRVFTITNSGNYVVSASTPPTGSAETLTVRNTLVNPMLDIHKQDDAATIPRALSGATFTLKQTYIGNTAVTADQENTYTWISSDTNITGDSGTWLNAADSTNTLSGLTDGTYVLYESKAPAGYAMHSGQVTFTVTDGVLNVTNPNATASGLVAVNANYFTSEVQSNVVHFKLTFQNTAGTELPSTGQAFGLSRMGFASLGTVLLSAFVVLYYYKKKQRYYADLGEDER